MTLRLVSDNEKPTPDFIKKIAEQARAFADELEAGTHGNVIRIVLAIEFEGGLDVEGWGDHRSPFEMMGLFDAAKMMTFANALPE